jgi:hypothetical protein
MFVCCHNCGRFYHLSEFIEIYTPDLLEEYKFWGFSVKQQSLANETLQALESVEAIPEVKESPSFVWTERLHELTVDFNLLADEHPARLYVENRHIPFNKVRYCKNFHKLCEELALDNTHEQYSIPCMLIPFYLIDRKIEVFQGRFFDNKVKPKYMTVKLNPDALKIYNKDFVDQSKTIYIMEGPVDSLHAENAIALGGSDGSVDYPNQVWCFDNEADNEQINKKLSNKIERKEKVIIWKKSDLYKDLNEGIVRGMIRESDVGRILKERTFSGIKAKLEFVKWKKNH